MASSELGERKEEELLQQNSRICFPSFHPPTTFLVPSFTVQMIFFIAPAGNKLKSEREEQEAATAAIAWRERNQMRYQKSF